MINSSAAPVSDRIVAYFFLSFLLVFLLPFLALTVLLLPEVGLVALLFGGFLLVSEGKTRLSPGGRAVLQVRRELRRLGVGGAVVEGSGDALTITLGQPHRIGSCSEVCGWLGSTSAALQVLRSLPPQAGESLLADAMMPSSPITGQIAAELDRLGVSDAATDNGQETPWVEAEVDLIGTRQLSPVLFVRGGPMNTQGPGITAWTSPEDALKTLEKLPDKLGVDAFWARMPKTPRLARQEANHRTKSG